MANPNEKGANPKEKVDCLPGLQPSHRAGNIP